MADITFTAGRLALPQLRAIARTDAALRLDPACRPEIEAGAATVAAIVDENRTAYGINTGFGKLAQTRIPTDRLEQLQTNLVLSHATGTGPLLDDAIVRLILALKLNGLARGRSGVRWVVIEALQALLDARAYPCIPAKGSVGASGDLAPLAHMSAALLGEGEIRLKGKRWPAADALHQIGLKPLTLAPKEGLALLNGTQVSTALALFGLFAAEEVFAAGLVAGAMSVDAARGSDAPFDARIHEWRGQPGQIEVAATLRGLLEHSAIRASHVENDDRVQDPYSLRCQPQVMGACLDQIRHAARVLEIEANAVSDNPLVFPETGDVISGGNFHAEPVAFAADNLALAIAEIGAMSERRIALLTDSNLSGLPPFLVSDPGVNSGFMIAHVTAAALASENKSLAHPSSVDSLPTSANQEDHVSMATHAARRLGEMAENTAVIVGVELLAAAQGIDFHRPLRSAEPIEAAVAVLRAKVRKWDEDRFFAPDIEAAKGLVQAGTFLAYAAGLLPSAAEGRVMDAFRLHRGTAPLLLSIPHVGTGVPDAIRARLTPEGQLLRDTDWHLDRLYDFAEGLGVSIIQAAQSRYVIDLNRPADDQSLYPGQATTGLCSTIDFDGRPLYQPGMEPDAADIAQRVETVWKPYHAALAAELERIKAQHGYALLYDAHSIRSVVPRLFDGLLPDLNLGSNGGTTAAPALKERIAEICRTAKGFTHVVDGRFKGGIITRHYGQPERNVHALQMELAQRHYMDEDPPFTYQAERAKPLQAVLRRVLEAMLAWKP